MNKKVIIAKIPLDRDGRPTIDFPTVQKFISNANERMPEGIEIMALPFVDFLIVGEDDIVEVDKVKTMNFDQLKKFIKE